MTRRKHLKQSEVRTLPNVFHSKQPGLDKLIRTYFNNNNPFTLELGCGNGEYSNTLAQKHPDRNFLGIDRAGARIWAASKASLNLNLTIPPLSLLMSKNFWRFLTNLSLTKSGFLIRTPFLIVVK